LTRKLLGMADRIFKLKDEEVDMINGYLKILKSDWRITKTEISQIKKGFDKLKGMIK